MDLTAQGNASLPCVFPRFSRRLGRLIPLHPAVDCEGQCASCPWNEAEKNRRREKGNWRRGSDGLLRLHFSPREEAISCENTREEDTP